MRSFGRNPDRATIGEVHSGGPVDELVWFGHQDLPGGAINRVGKAIAIEVDDDFPG
jgi:hypothetical protein